MSDPSELILIEEIALGVFFKRDGGVAGRQLAILVLSYIRNHRDSGCHLVDVAVGEGDAHGTGTDVARCAARWRACWKGAWEIHWHLSKSTF